MRKNLQRSIDRLLTLATITHVAEDEHVAIEGSFAYETPEQDREAENYVRHLAARTIWGWCCVRTTASWEGFTASVHLGCCSYESEQDFIASDDGAQAREACAALFQAICDAQRRGREAHALMCQLGTV